MEITEYHPFKSPEAKETILNIYDDAAKAWPVPSENKIVNTSYGKTFVRISGPSDAPPLVLLHGMGSNSLMWIRNIEKLSKDFRTYAIDDLYGNGRSIYTKTINDSDGFDNWLDELLNALNIDNKINLMGMSYGGWQASQYALKFQNRINKLILLAPAATILPIGSSFAMRAILSMIPIRYFTKNLLYWVMEDAVKQDEIAFRDLVDFMFLASRAYKTRKPPQPTVLSDEELKRLKVPVLYLVGTNEKIYSSQNAIQRLNTLVPQIETELIPDAGHDLVSVQPDMINEKVLEFLK